MAMNIETLRRLPTAELLRAVDRSQPEVRALAERVERAEAACLGALAGEIVAGADSAPVDEAARIRAGCSHLQTVVVKARLCGLLSAQTLRCIEDEIDLNLASAKIIDGVDDLVQGFFGSPAA